MNYGGSNVGDLWGPGWAGYGQYFGTFGLGSGDQGLDWGLEQFLGDPVGVCGMGQGNDGFGWAAGRNGRFSISDLKFRTPI